MGGAALEALEGFPFPLPRDEGGSEATDRGLRDGAPRGRSPRGPGGPKPEGPRLAARSFSRREGSEEPRPTEEVEDLALWLGLLPRGIAHKAIPARGRRKRPDTHSDRQRDPGASRHRKGLATSRGRRPRQNLARSSRGGRRAWRPSARRPNDLLVGASLEAGSSLVRGWRDEIKRPDIPGGRRPRPHQGEGSVSS
jgi:hypothetical protein